MSDQHVHDRSRRHNTMPRRSGSVSRKHVSVWRSGLSWNAGIKASLAIHVYWFV
jgi:hypothetical protein